jgi:hypothetical protein
MTSRLRATLQRLPGAMGPSFGRAAPGVSVAPGTMPGVAGIVGAWPVDRVDGQRPPSLTTGPSTDEG